MKLVLEAIAILPPDDQEEAIATLAKALVANGLTQSDLSHLMRMVGKLRVLTGQTSRPH